MNIPKVVAIIPAKGRSVGVPGKNKREIAGKSLVLWSIEAAQGSKCVSQVVVSTDDPDIGRIARKASALVLDRPPELAKDDTSTEAVMSQVLLSIREPPEITLLLQPTSPFRMADDVDQAVELLVTGGYDSVLSVTPDYHFYWLGQPDRAAPMNYLPYQRPMRQDIAPLFRENGSIYAFWTEGYLKVHCRIYGKVGLYVMRHPWAGIEIDTPYDFQLMRMALQLPRLKPEELEVPV